VISHSTSSQPSPPLKTLAYGRRRLRRSASRCAFLAASRACSARISAPMMRPPQNTSRFLVPMAGTTATIAEICNDARVGCWDGRLFPKRRSMSGSLQVERFGHPAAAPLRED
jgi:hypothetical protein